MTDGLPTISPVRLDDLAEPRFPEGVAGIRQQMAELAEVVPFDGASLCAIAAAETGIEEPVDAGYAERLHTVLGFYAKTPLSAQGRLGIAGQFLQFTKSRLLVDRELARHPEIRDQIIAPPVIIAGLPRTGTTHLHNLMASDPGLRYLPYWESVEPVLPDDQRGAVVDPRWERTETALQTLNEMLPYFKRMHHMTTWHAHEEINLLALDCSSMLFETLALTPDLRDWYKSHDQTPHYQYCKTVMQVLQHLRKGPTRWVLKSPQNLEQLAALNQVFPDATVVFTHRDPVSVTASMVTMSAYLLRTSYDRLDLEAVGRYWAERVQDLLMACVADRHLIPPERSLDVAFSEYMADQVGTLERIYDLAALPVTDAARRGWRTYLADHPRDRHGKVLYELEPFGLDPAERRVALAPYAQRFGLDPATG